jgi:hypothetical protein
MDPKAAERLKQMVEQLGQQNVAALMVYTQLLKRMQIRTLRVFPASVLPEAY